MVAYNNNNEYNLDGVPYSEYKKKSKKEYELVKHERESCIEIRKRITAQSYKDPDEIREHLELIEDLLGKIENIINVEVKEGLSNLSLQRDYSKIKNLYNDLSRVLDKLESF
jgi:hypothetical protein